MYVIHAGPEVGRISDSSIRAFVPDLSSSAIFFRIPLKRAATVKLSNPLKELVQLTRA